MATETIDGALGEIRVASTTSGGTALSTTISLIQLPLYSQWLSLTPRNFTTAVVARFSLNPWLYVLKTSNNLASQPHDYSEDAQDADTGTSVDLSSLSTLANGDFLLVGSHLPFRGASIDIDATNSNASVLTVAAWDGVAWTSVSATDNTDSGGASLGQDGTVTWTVPTAWKSASLETICNRVGPSLVSASFPGKSEDLYWTRWVWSAALDATVTLDSLVSLNRSTNYAELLPGQVFTERIKHGPSGIGCLEALTDAGTANLIINVAMLSTGGSFK